jgi:hypothetical protein
VTFALQQLIPSIWANEQFRRANSLANTNIDALSIEHNQVDHGGGDEWLTGQNVQKNNWRELLWI